MLTLNNVLVQDTYQDALTLGPVPTCQKIVYLVANAAVIAQLAGTDPSLTTQEWGPELLITPQAGEFQRLQGVRFKNAQAGVPARVVAQLIQPDDPVPVGGTPFTQSLTGAGGISSQLIIPNVALGAFPPAGPVDGQALSLVLTAAYDQATGKTLRYLIEWDATNAIWQVHDGKPIHKQDSTHSFGYTGGGAAQDPSSVLTGVTPITVPRPGLYRYYASLVALDTNVGGGHDPQIIPTKNGAAIAGPIGEARTDSQAGVANSLANIFAAGEVQCAGGDTIGMTVACGVNGISFFNAVLEIEPIWLT